MHLLKEGRPSDILAGNDEPERIWGWDLQTACQDPAETQSPLSNECPCPAGGAKMTVNPSWAV